jgi:hypothetical protein
MRIGKKLNRQTSILIALHVGSANIVSMQRKNKKNK